MAPFNDEQIETYIKRHLELKEEKEGNRGKLQTDGGDTDKKSKADNPTNVTQEKAKQLRDRIRKVKGLEKLITQPLLLLMTIEVLESLEGEKGREMNRLILYDKFTEKFFDRAYKKAQNSANGIPESLQSRPLESFRRYAEIIAGHMLATSQYVIKIEEDAGNADEIEKLARNNPKAKKAMQNAAPVRKFDSNEDNDGEASVQFIHKSKQDHSALIFVYLKFQIFFLCMCIVSCRKSHSYSYSYSHSYSYSYSHSHSCPNPYSHPTPSKSRYPGVLCCMPHRSRNPQRYREGREKD